MSLLEETKSLLRTYRILPKERFGQNFLVEPSIFQQMIGYASLGHDDIVLDVGAGLGFLTRLIAEKCKTVIAVEVDKELVSILHKQLSDLSNVKLVESDVFKANIPEFDKIISTPPYNISSKLLLWIFDQRFVRAVLVFQKEFADRLVATVGSEDYGWLTVFTHYCAQVELLDDVPNSLFYPQPDVDSVIARLIPKRHQSSGKIDMISFRRFVQVLFTHRNKKVKGAIQAYLRSVRGMSKTEALKGAERLPNLEKRIRDLDPEDFGALMNVI